MGVGAGGSGCKYRVVNAVVRASPSKAATCICTYSVERYPLPAQVS